MTIITDLHTKRLIKPPKFLIDNTHYLCYMGSVAYGVSSDSSDNDVYGFCIPPKEIIFPHLAGHIPGFGESPPAFGQWQEHHVEDNETRKNWDFCIYSIIKFFNLCMGNNPNMIDALFIPQTCVLHSTAIGNKVRDNRKLFLSKRVWHKFKGYAYSQLHKMRTKVPDMGSNRWKSYEQYGYDVKFAYHCVRLLQETEQILTEGDLDLRRGKNLLKSIRRGEWSMDKVIGYFDDKEKQLEEVCIKSELPWQPDEKKIKYLLIECLEQHFGPLSLPIRKSIGHEVAIQKIRDICDNYL